MPFSDPTADGPVIQRASERALANGTTLREALEVRARASARASDVADRALRLLQPDPRATAKQRLCDGSGARPGVDGFLVVDLPPEEARLAAAPALAANGLAFVPLVAPTTPDARVDARAHGRGRVPLLRVAHRRDRRRAPTSSAPASAPPTCAQRTGKPVAVGFGVKTPDDVAKPSRSHADGVVVGSAVCRAIEAGEEPDEAVRAVRELVGSLRAACGKG